MQNIWKQEALRSDDLELIILPGIGGRLWDVVFQGRSLLFQNSDLDVFVPDTNNLRDYPTNSPQFGFPLWGGEKTWIAPDSNWPDGAPFATLDSGPHEISGKSARHIALKSAVCPQSSLQIEREIRLAKNSAWTIQHKVINRGVQDRKVGIWSVMMLDHKACIGVTGQDLKATQVFGQPEEFVSTQDVGLICDCSKLGEFKVGIENQNGRTFMYLDHHDKPIWMRCDTPLPTADDTFAHTHPLEVFNSGDYAYCEAEWHAPLRSLSPGETTEFTQRFTIWTDILNQKPTNEELELMQCMS